MNLRAKRRALQRQAFIAYIKRVKSGQQTWTGWKKELVLQALDA